MKNIERLQTREEYLSEEEREDIFTSAVGAGVGEYVMHLVSDNDTEESSQSTPIDLDNHAEVINLKEFKRAKEHADDTDEIAEEVESILAVNGTTDESYINRLAKHSLLSKREEIALAKRIEKGDLDAKEEMILKNIKLVISQTRRYNLGLSSLSHTDLVQEGVIGLIRAAEKFDHRKGFRFSTYATLWIRQTLQRATQDKGDAIRLPVNIHEKLRRINRLQRGFVQKNNGREPTMDELAEITGYTVENIEHTRNASDMAVVSLDKEVGSDERKSPLGALIPNGELDPADEVIKDDNAGIVLDALLDLPPRTAQALRMKFGLDGYDESTYREIAKELSITIEGARQVVERGLSRLRSNYKISELN